MNKQISALFDTAFSAPGGIKKLREMILTLAMQGKLVPQDPSDPPASELLKEIEAKKKRLVKEGKIKSAKPLPDIKPEEMPYKLPEGWVWARLDDLVSKIGSGSTPRGGKSSYIDNGIPFLRSQNIWNDDIKLEDVAFISQNTHKKMSATEVFPNDILLNITGASLGRCALVPENWHTANVSQHVTIIRCINKEQNRFIHSLLLSPYCQRLIWSRQVGMAREGLSKKVLESFEIPIPPFSEQHRIVAKIDQLMARCDELEKLRAEREQMRLAIHTSAIRQLLAVPAEKQNDQSTEKQDSNTRSGLPAGQAAQFIARHFGELYTVKENVAELRKAILQLAVMGKLVPQDPNDPPACELLKEIKAEKKRLVKEGKIKSEKPLPEIKLEEVTYKIPESWKWARLEQLTQIITKGSSPNWQGVQYVNEGEGILFITSENVGNYNLILEKKKYVESKFNEIEPRSILVKQDILMNIVGASIGRTAIFDLDIVANINQAVTIIRLINIANHKYFLNFFNSPICISYMNDKQVDNARPNLSMGNIALFKIPLPPLPEQHRIVTKIDELMSLCDVLEQQIDAATTKQTELLDAMMAQF